MEKVIVLAADSEYEQIKPLTKTKIIKTGIGYANVIKSLQNLNRNTKIINIGYAGSNVIPRGTIVKVKNCFNYHPNCGEFEEPKVTLNGTTDCYTSGDFVVKTDITEPVVFDMELYAICAMGFKDIESYKVVSDCLSLDQYEEANFTKKFEEIISLIGE